MEDNPEVVQDFWPPIHTLLKCQVNILYHFGATFLLPYFGSVDVKLYQLTQ